MWNTSRTTSAAARPLRIGSIGTPTDLRTFCCQSFLADPDLPSPHSVRGDASHTPPKGTDMSTIRFERRENIGSIVLANPPYNRIDIQYAASLREAVHAASESDIRVLVVRAEGPHFSLGGEVREWPGKDINWFRTFVADVNASYRAIEALRVPTVAVVRGLVFGGGLELALACDFIVAAEDAVFRCVEVTTGMVPIAGALQRLAERAGRARASRFSMLG